MKKIVYSAPAKVIISGEHAVVYGKPALVAALDIRLRFSLWEGKNTEGDKRDLQTISIISETVKKYLKNNSIPFGDRDFRFRIDSEVPIKQRLGSSAALAVATSAAFLHWYTGRSFDKETVNNVAYQVEKYFHKNSSGVDTSVSTFGGLLFYRKEFEFLKHISVLNFKIPKKFADGLYLVDSGDAAESTGEMVEKVAKLYNDKPSLTEQILNDIEKVTKRIVVAIVKEDKLFFEQCIVDNQIFLGMLGVSSKKADNLLKKIGKFGVGKVTGGGGKIEGSGFMLFFTDKKKDFEEFCLNERIPFFKFNPSYDGLRSEI